MDSENVKKLSKSIGNRLTKKNFSASELSELGTEIGIVCARHFEEGYEEHDMDEFLFGFVNSIYDSIRVKNRKAQSNTDGIQEKDPSQ